MEHLLVHLVHLGLLGRKVHQVHRDEMVNQEKWDLKDHQETRGRKVLMDYLVLMVPQDRGDHLANPAHATTAHHRALALVLHDVVKTLTATNPYQTLISNIFVNNHSY